jgi:ferredoxin
MRVVVDATACCASGMCVLTAPDVFDQDDDTGSVVLLQDQPPAELHADVRRAADLCPARAITITE